MLLFYIRIRNWIMAWNVISFIDKILKKILVNFKCFCYSYNRNMYKTIYVSLYS